MIAGGLAVAALFVLERLRPLRRRTVPTPPRAIVNAEVGAVTGVVLQFLFMPVTQRVARLVEERRLGLLLRLPVPIGVARVAGVVLLDYTLYWWHRMLHHVPLLWRCHAVHHSDLDLDVLTALRFHFGEWIASTLYRSLQIVVIGTDRRTAAIFEVAAMLATQFHHSNLRLPLGRERRLVRLVVTPRMHGIHHSILREEADRNYATILTIWDRLHDTLSLAVPQRRITIGLPNERSQTRLSALRLLLLPFRRESHPALSFSPSSYPSHANHLAP